METPCDENSILKHRPSSKPSGEAFNLVEHY
jgi:hypothetical protein